MRKEISLLYLQGVYEKLPERKIQKVMLKQCPKFCNYRNTPKCSIDGCEELEKQYARLIRRALARAIDANPEEPIKILKSLKQYDHSQLYDGIYGWGVDEGEFDAPIYDIIYGDRTVWAIPHEDRDGEQWVSHRCNIYGIRNKQWRLLTIVEVYDHGWKYKHDRCDIHRLNPKRIKRYLCPECGGVAKKRIALEEYSIRGKRIEGRLCDCGAVVEDITVSFEYPHVCKSCDSITRAKARAWYWFAQEKLNVCGIDVSFLPFTHYKIAVMELNRKNSKSKGRVWH